MILFHCIIIQFLRQNICHIPQCFGADTENSWVLHTEKRSFTLFSQVPPFSHTFSIPILSGNPSNPNHCNLLAESWSINSHWRSVYRKGLIISTRQARCILAELGECPHMSRNYSQNKRMAWSSTAHLHSPSSVFTCRHKHPTSLIRTHW